MNVIEIRSKLARGAGLADLPLRVTYYARVSTSREEQEHSLKNQKEFFEKLITDNKNWACVEGFFDEGITGTSVKKRVSFLRMIEDAKNDKFDLILTKEVSRFARDTIDTLTYTRNLLVCGVGVYFLSDNINTFDTEGELRLTIMASMAQEESRKISERIRFGQRKAIQDGNILGNPPLGYSAVVDEISKKKRLEIIEGEAEIVRKMYDLYISGLGFRLVGDKLASLGYRTRNGNLFTTSTVASCIKNPKYKGSYVGGKYGRVAYNDHRQYIKDTSEWKIIENHDNIPAIVDEEVWNRANDIYNAKSKQMKNSMQADAPHGKIGHYLYSNKIICQEHNTNFHRVFQKGKEKWQCQAYRHKGVYGCDLPTIYTEELNAIMRQIFAMMMKNKDSIINNATNDIERLAGINSTSSALPKLKQEFEKLYSARMNLVGMMAEGLIDKETFKDKDKIYREKIAEIEQKLSQSNQAHERIKALKSDIERIKNAVAGYVDLDNDEILHNFIKEYLTQIKIGKTETEGMYSLKIYILNSNNPIDMDFFKTGRGSSSHCELKNPSESKSVIMYNIAHGV